MINWIVAFWFVSLFIENGLIANEVFSIGPSYVFSGLITFYGAARWVQSNCKVVRRGTIIFILGFSVTILFSIIVSINPLTSIFWATFLTQYVLALLSLSYLASVRYIKPEKILLGVLIATAAFSLNAIAHGYTSGGRFVLLTGLNPGHLAGALGILSVIGFKVSQIGSPLRAWTVSYPLALWFIFLLILSGGKSGIIALFGGWFLMVGWVLLTGIRGWNKIGAKLLVWGILGAMISTFLIDVLGVVGYDLRASKILEFDGSVESLGSEREKIWSFYLEAMVDNLRVVGLHMVYDAYNYGYSPHNIWIRALLESSVFGVILLASVIFSFMARAFQKKDLYMIWAVLYLFIYSFGNDVIYQKEFWAIVGVIILIDNCRMRVFTSNVVRCSPGTGFGH